MAYGLDAGEGFEFLLGAVALLVGGLEIAVDELDRLVEAAGGLGLPNFAKPPPPSRSMTGHRGWVRRGFQSAPSSARPGRYLGGEVKETGSACCLFRATLYRALKPSFLQCESQTTLCFMPE